jgi:hypothetical protein
MLTAVEVSLLSLKFYTRFPDIFKVAFQDSNLVGLVFPPRKARFSYY